MQQDQQVKGNLGSIMDPEFAGRDVQSVKQQIQMDVRAGGPFVK